MPHAGHNPDSLGTKKRVLLVHRTLAWQLVHCSHVGAGATPKNVSQYDSRALGRLELFLGTWGTCKRKGDARSAFSIAGVRIRSSFCWSIHMITSSCSKGLKDTSVTPRSSAGTSMSSIEEIGTNPENKKRRTVPGSRRKKKKEKALTGT